NDRRRRAQTEITFSRGTGRGRIEHEPRSFHGGKLLRTASQLVFHLGVAPVGAPHAGKSLSPIAANSSKATRLARDKPSHILSMSLPSVCAKRRPTPSCCH